MAGEVNSRPVRYEPAKVEQGERPSVAEIIDPNNDGLLTQDEFEHNAGVYYGRSNATDPRVNTTPFALFEHTARAVKQHRKPAERALGAGEASHLTTPYPAEKAGPLRDDRRKRLYGEATQLFQLIRNAEDPPTELAMHALARAGHHFITLGHTTQAIACFRLMIHAAEDGGHPVEAAVHRAMLAIAQERFEEVRTIVAALPADAPGRAALEQTLAAHDHAVRMGETYAVVAALANTDEAFAKRLGEDWKFQLLSALSVTDSAELDVRRADLRSTADAWKQRLAAGDSQTSMAIAESIWNEGTPSEKRGLYFLATREWPTDAELDRPLEAFIESRVGNQLTLSHALAWESALAATRAEKFGHDLRLVAANAGEFGKAQLVGVLSATSGSRELQEISQRVWDSEFGDDATFARVRDALGGLTDPVNLTIMVGGFGLARVTTTAILGRAAAGAGKLAGWSKLPYTAGELAVEAGAFSLYHRGLEEALTTQGVDWSASGIAKDWASLTLRFAFARAAAAPLRRVEGQMARTRSLGNGAGGLGRAGQAVSTVGHHYAQTAGFFGGGFVAHQLGLEEQGSSFVEEQVALLQFQLGVKVAGRVAGAVTDAATRARLQASVDAAEKLVGDRASPFTHFIASALASRMSGREAVRLKRLLGHPSPDFKAINRALEKAGDFVFDGQLHAFGSAETRAQAARAVERDGPGAAAKLVSKTHIGATVPPRLAPVNPSGRRDNCTACTVAELLNRRGDTDLWTADLVEATFGYTGRERGFVGPDSLEYISTATGVSFSAKPAAFMDPSAPAGDYVIFWGRNGELMHVTYGHIAPDGTKTIHDPQINRDFTWVQMAQRFSHATEGPGGGRAFLVVETRH